MKHVIVKWGKKRLQLPLNVGMSQLMKLIYDSTRIHPSRQKVLSKYWKGKYTACSKIDFDMILEEKGEVLFTLIGSPIELHDSEASNRALLHAAETGDSSTCVDMIKNHGANIDTTTLTKGKFTPLELSIINGHEGTCIELLNLGAQIVGKLRTAFHCTVESGQANLVQVLIQWIKNIYSHGGNDISSRMAINCRDQAGDTALHIAARKGYTKICHLLLLAGADVNSENDFGFTPLHEACAAKSVKSANICSTLIGMGANVGKVSAIRKVSLNKLVRYFERRNLRQSYKHITPLHVAAENGKYKISKVLIARGAEVSVENDIGQTALHLVALTSPGSIKMSSKKAIVNLLMKNGADSNAKDFNGMSVKVTMPYLGE